MEVVMALTSCPDCGKQISTAAPSCIGCGRPMMISRAEILQELQLYQMQIDQYERENPDDFIRADVRLGIGSRMGDLERMLKNLS
jgi:hypothetical protein